MAAKAKQTEEKPNGKPEFDLSIDKIDLRLKRIPFDVTEKDGVTKRTYYLQELTGAERDAYQQELIFDHMTRRDNGDLETVKYNGLYALLLSRSIVTPEEKLISREEVQSWPAPAQKTLYLAARKLSALDSAARQDAEKNS